MSDPANSSKRSATFSRYSRATSAFQGGIMCESNPDEVALPGLAFRTPEPDSTPEAVCEASPDVEAVFPSLDDGGPAFLFAILSGLLAIDSKFAFSLPRPVTSEKS